MKPIWIISFLLFCSTAFAKPADLSQHLLDTVLKPWVTSNLPEFQYVGDDPYCDRPVSWRFVQRDDPHLRKTFALDIEMEFCLTESTARKYIHRSDWSYVGVPNTGSVPSHIGDDSDVFDYRTTYQGRDPSSVGGWVYCRVGTCLFFIRSYSVTIEAMKDLAGKIATEVPHLPEPPQKVRSDGEIGFLRAIADSKKQEEEFKKIPLKDRLSYPLGGAPQDDQKK